MCFRIYNNCGYCGNRNETAVHYFLECTAFAAPRQNLLRSLRAIDGLTVPSDNELNAKKHKDLLTNIIIFGTKCIEIDRQIFDQTHNFIVNSKRFV